MKNSEEKKELKLVEKRSEKKISEFKEEERKELTTRLKTSKISRSDMNDVFISGRVQKEKAELRKIALEKRKQYGQMIQKQVLKMYKKKNSDGIATQVTRFSQGSKKESQSPEKLKIIDFALQRKIPKRSVSVFHHPLRKDQSPLSSLKAKSKEFDKKNKRQVEIMGSKPSENLKTRNKNLHLRQGIGNKNITNISRTKVIFIQ